MSPLETIDNLCYEVTLLYDGDRISYEEYVNMIEELSVAKAVIEEAAWNERT